MKKFTFILFALIAGTTFAQTATANAAADIVSPLSLTAKQDLNFGKVSNNTAGSVIIATDGTASGLSQIGTTAPAAATFDVTAANNYNYTVALPASATLSNGTVDITVDTFKHNAYAEGASNATGSGTAQTFGVGATLNVAASQATGNYTGQFDVTVAYE
ncbi:DUF4402 domain-containing protein [Salinimicrobium terrae]|uniref:DUF4402 domain-containing protein n=1 Tax=Salinimicrobium terrae TaxID=470866 RepID=UPI0003F700AF|nr:DUF4402 domain-containing protein [Salinimicrobium terrae]